MGEMSCRYSLLLPLSTGRQHGGHCIVDLAGGAPLKWAGQAPKLELAAAGSLLGVLGRNRGLQHYNGQTATVKVPGIVYNRINRRELYPGVQGKRPMPIPTKLRAPNNTAPVDWGELPRHRHRR